MRMRTPSVAIVLCCTVLVTPNPGRAQTRPSATRPAVTSRPAAAGEHDFGKWERAIAAYERMDRTDPPAKGGTLFIGSSTIVRWKSLNEDFPGHHLINRGFGGSHIVDSTHFAERIIFPYEPRMIFLRAGGNDIHAGKSAEQVFADYKAFVAKVHAKLPGTQIVFISLCPAPSRWEERDANKALNTLVEKYTRQIPYLKYVETYDMVLGADGQPRPELFIADKLHLSAAGYKLLAECVRPFLSK